MATTSQQTHALVSHYLKKYKELYGFDALVNRNKAKWRVYDMLLDVSYSDAVGLIDYYFDTVGPHNHELDWFLYNYDKLITAKQERDNDAAERARLREETKRRTEEWRKKIWRPKS